VSGIGHAESFEHNLLAVFGGLPNRVGRSSLQGGISGNKAGLNSL
jgi:hypothetical protein